METITIGISKDIARKYRDKQAEDPLFANLTLEEMLEIINDIHICTTNLAADAWSSTPGSAEKKARLEILMNIVRRITEYLEYVKSIKSRKEKALKNLESVEKFLKGCTPR